ncbi:DUF2240 family protein [Candidatus Woesearchaeota archaeon]|nr:DUF2240 family protein [Candidatus Woesearchaeota archaeon]
MIKIPYAVLLEKIKTKTGMTEEAIEAQLQQKMEQLSGLISKEGAAHILANELKIDLSAPQLALKIRDLYAGMKTGEILGKVMRKYDVRDFQSGERKGKVGSFLIADETGTMRVTCWNEQTKEMDPLQENDIVVIQDGNVRENRGALEVHLNERTKIIRNPEGKTVIAAKVAEPLFVRKAIKDLSGTDVNVEILGTIVQVFEPKFYERCPVCRKRIKQQEVGFQCPEHGLTKPDYGYVMNVYLDDGSGNIRVVFFGQQMQQLLKKNDEEILVYRTTPQAFDKVKTDLLGEMLKASGRVNKNEMFARLEFVANKIEMNINPEEEISRLQQELEKAQT